MGKKGGKETQTSSVSVDPRAARVQNALWAQAQGIANTPFAEYNREGVASFDPALAQQLRNQYTQGMGAFGTGYNILTGLAGQLPDASAFYNPFEQNVAQAAQGNFDVARNRAFNSLNQQAAATGGFRNSRLDLGYGQAAADIANQEAQTLSGLRYSGYMDAQDRARMQQQMQEGLGTNLVNLGMGSAAANQNFGAYQRDIAQQKDDFAYQQFMRRQMDPYLKMQAMSGALQGPWGMSSKNVTEKQGGWLSGLLGVGGTVAGALLGGPAGAAAGGSIGSAIGGGGSQGGALSSGYSPWMNPADYQLRTPTSLLSR